MKRIFLLASAIIAFAFTGTAQTANINVLDAEGNICSKDTEALTYGATAQLSLSSEYVGQNMAVCLWLISKGGNELLQVEEVTIDADGQMDIVMPDWDQLEDSYISTAFGVYSWYAATIQPTVPADASELGNAVARTDFEKKAHATLSVVNEEPIVTGGEIEIENYGFPIDGGFGVVTWLVDGEQATAVAGKSVQVTDQTMTVAMPAWDDLPETMTTSAQYCVGIHTNDGSFEGAISVDCFEKSDFVFDPNLRMQNNPVPAWGTNVIFDIDDETLLGTTATLSIYNAGTSTLVDQFQHGIHGLGEQWVWNTFSNCGTGSYTLVLQVQGMPPVSYNFQKQ